MSKRIFKRLILAIMITLTSIIVLGCKSNKVAVKDIYFDEPEKIVLLVGEEYTPKVSISPTYATNKNYFLTSLKETVVKVQNDKIVALSGGDAMIRVTSEDKKKLQDIMTVSVVDEIETLQTPVSLRYDSANQMIGFNAVNNAVKYILEIDGEEIDLGNSTSYSLSKYAVNHQAYDKMLNVRVKAIAPSYTKAYENSPYCEMVSFYQNSSVENAKVQGGVLTFDKKEGTVSNIYLNDTLYIEGTNANQIDLTGLDPRFAGTNISVKVKAYLSNKDENDGYFMSQEVSVPTYCLEIPSLTVDGAIISWQNISKSSNYKISIDNNDYVSKTNYIDLSEEKFNWLVFRDTGYVAFVDTVLVSESENIIKTSARSSISFNRFTAPEVSLSGQNVNFTTTNANLYSVTLTSANMTYTATTSNTYFNLGGYESDRNYTLSVKANGKDINGTYFISSPLVTKEFKKQDDPNLSVENYLVKFNEDVQDDYLLTIDDKDFGIINNDYDLSPFVFEKGNHVLALTHLGNYEDEKPSIDSNTIVWNFAQLAKVERKNIAISNSIFNLTSDEVNIVNNAKQIIITRTEDDEEKFTTEELNFAYNTARINDENYLESGKYYTTVQVIGDGSRTFSYREKVDDVMTVVDCAKVEFEVLRAPVLNYEVPSPENPGYTNTIYFDAIDNAVRYNLRRNGLTPPGYNESSTRFSYAVKDGEQVDYLVKACGDGVHFLDSCDSNLVSLRSLVAPRIGFDNVTNSLYLVEESEPNYGVGGYWLTYNGYISSCKLGQDIYETMPIVANQNNLVGARAFTIDQTEDNDTVWAPQGIYFIASGDSESLNISRIDSQTLVSVENVSNNLDYHDNLILQPSHGREYNLRLKIEVDSVVYNFETVQGTRVLRCDTCLKNHAGEHDEACYEINYSYDYAGKYYIPLLNSMFDSIVPNEEFKNVLVNVEYFDAPGTMNAKSGFWTQNVELKFTNQTVLERRNQDIVIKNIDADRDYSNFALLLNGDNLMMLDETCEKKENEIFVSMDKIYEALGDKFVETNSICAVTINNLDEKTISRKSEPIYFEIYKTVDLTTSKDNSTDDNSVKITFATEFTEYEKDYYLIIQDELENFEILSYSHPEMQAENRQVVVNLDEQLTKLKEEKSLTFGKNLSISIMVTSNGNYVKDDKTIYVYNSRISAPLTYVMVDEATEVSSVGGILTFAEKSNVTGYEIYRLVDGIYKKENIGLIPAVDGFVRYDLNTLAGTQRIKIKSVASTVYEMGGYTNSFLTDEILVTKLESPIVNLEHGEFVLSMSVEGASKFKTLMLDDSVNLFVQVKNATYNKEITVNLKELTTGCGVVYYEDDSSNILAIDPYLIMNYGIENIVNEEIKFAFLIDCANTIDDSLYINSNLSSASFAGLFAPSNITKTTFDLGSGEYVEFMAWTPSEKNKNIEVGYVFRLSYRDNVYYSNDSALKYLDNGVFKSYGKYIESNANVPFPYAYDKDRNGYINPSEILVDGLYSVMVKSVPILNAENYCASKYSESWQFEILPSPVIRVENGQITWDKVTNASEYSLVVTDVETSAVSDLTIYDSTENVVVVNDESLFTDGKLYTVTVQAKNTKDTNILNGRLSEEFYAYKLSNEDTSAYIDDGNLFVVTNIYHSKMIIEFEFSTDSTKKQSVIFDASAIALQNLNAFKVSNNVTNLINTTLEQRNDLKENSVYKVKINNNEILPLIEGQNYKINVKLIGNNDNSFALLNSSVNENVSSLMAGKLTAENIYTVNNGSVTFKKPTTTASLKYKINDTEDEILNNSGIFKIKIKRNDSEDVIYAIDYSVLDESNSKFVKQDVGSLWGYYLFTDSKGNNVYFNIFKNNTINLNSYSEIKYYLNDYNADYNLIGTGESVTIDLEQGGSFGFTFALVGGDVDSDIGYLTSNERETNTFTRYKMNEVSAHNGKFKFLDLYDETLQDVPVYKLTTNPLNVEEYTNIYLYYPSFTEEEVKEYIGDNFAHYVEISQDMHLEDEGGKYIIFDLSNYLGEDLGYNVDLKTLVGPKSDNNYLINSCGLNKKTSLSKMPNVEFALDEDGRLDFTNAYILNGKDSVYSTDYEIVVEGNGTVNVLTIKTSDAYARIYTAEDLEKHVLYMLSNAVNNFRFKSGVIYKFSMRALAPAGSTYILDGQISNEKEFTKMADITGLKIENGEIKWNNNFENGVTIRLSNEYGHIIEIDVENDDNKDVMSYAISDNMYTLLGTSLQQHVLGEVPYLLQISARGNSTSVLASGFTEGTVVSRLKQVNSSTIQTYNGILVWEDIANVDHYVITDNLGNVYTSKTNSLVVAGVEEGAYTFTVRAVGANYLNSQISSSSVSLIKLDNINGTGIDIVGNVVSWNKVAEFENIGYLVQINDLVPQIITDNKVEIPDSVNGEITVKITAIGVGFTTYLASDELVVELNERPKQVQVFDYDEENYEIYFEINPSDYVSGDVFLIKYKLNDEKITRQFNVEFNGNSRYVHKLIEIGTYKDLTIEVVRSGTVNSVVTTCDGQAEFKLFASGNGDSNPYVITNAEQLLNIKHFTSAKFAITSQIVLTAEQLKQNLSLGYVISENFSGHIEGNGNYVKFEDVTLNNNQNFALFKNLTNATIKNVNFNKENATKISKMFDNSNSNVLNLTIIASTVTSSAMENVNIDNFEISLVNNFGKDVFVAGFAVSATNSTFTNCKVGLKVDTTSTYLMSSNNIISGVACTMTNCTVNGLANDLEIVGALTNVKYAGGIAGEINSGAISNVVANVKFTDIRVANAGGLVAYQSGSGEIRFENVDVTLDYHEKTSNGLSGQNVGGILGTSRKAFVSGKVKFNYTNLNESIVGSVGAVSGVLAGGLTTNLDITINDVAYTGDINNKTTNSLVGTYGTANLGGSISEGD